MNFSKIVFYVAGIYGLIVLLPQYFLETKNGQDFPPVISHPEYYYGFVGVALSCQILFLIIARDPVCYRAMIIPAIIEKFSFSIATSVLFLQNRLAVPLFVAGLIDFVFGLLFVAVYFKTADTGKAAKHSHPL